MWPPAKPSPHRGEGGPKGRMRGEKVGSITPVGTLISLASLDSFPLKGGSLFCVGRDDSARPGPCACRGRQAPRKYTPWGRIANIKRRRGLAPPYNIALTAHYAHRAALRFVSPSVICFANATSLVRGRLFPWPPLTRGLSSAARLGERSPRISRRARQGCCALHITEELSLVWDVFIHLLEI